jgi:hypothetical protein
MSPWGVISHAQVRAATVTISRPAVGRRRAAGVAVIAERRSVWNVAALLLACVVASGSPAPSAQAAFSGRNGRIAYTAECAGAWIATMKPDGTRHRHLKVEGSSCGRYDPARVVTTCCASWAPDGRRLLFGYGVMVHDELGALLSNQSAFAVADADGSHRTVVPLVPPRPFPNEDFFRGEPSFAPDGRHFAYHRYAAQGADRPEIWTATVDGREDRRLGGGSSPRWSPDGRRIAYVAATRNAGTSREREGGTWLMSARTGKPLRRLWRRSAMSLDWAPDGRRLVASTDVGVRQRGLFILRANGKAAQPFTSPSRQTRRQLRNGVDAAWSPDGRRIVYVHHYGIPGESGEPDTIWEIWTISTRGARAQRIWRRNYGFDSDSAPPRRLAWQPLPPLRASP